MRKHGQPHPKFDVKKSSRAVAPVKAPQKGGAMNLNQFKTFSADRMEIDELVALLAFGKALRTEYEALQLEEPEYVDIQLKSLRREITARNVDKIEARKRELKSRIDSLKTPAQKKAELEAELNKLEGVAVVA